MTAGRCLAASELRTGSKSTVWTSPRRISEPVAGGLFPQLPVAAGVPLLPSLLVGVGETDLAQGVDRLVHGARARTGVRSGVLVEELHVLFRQADAQLHTYDLTKPATCGPTLHWSRFDPKRDY